jgi:hypothetical protein
VAFKLFQGHPFPLGGSLDDLGINGVHVAIVGDVKLDGSAGPVAIEHVVDAAFRVDDERNLDHYQAEFLA